MSYLKNKIPREEKVSIQVLTTHLERLNQMVEFLNEVEDEPHTISDLIRESLENTLYSRRSTLVKDFEAWCDQDTPAPDTNQVSQAKETSGVPEAPKVSLDGQKRDLIEQEKARQAQKQA